MEINVSMHILPMSLKCRECSKHAFCLRTMAAYILSASLRIKDNATMHAVKRQDVTSNRRVSKWLPMLEV